MASKTKTELDICHYELKKSHKRDYKLIDELLNKVLMDEPLNYQALLYQSQYYLMIGAYQLSLDNSNKILAEVDGNSVKAFYEKCQALFYLNEFEQSLIICHRVLAKRPKFIQFQNLRNKLQFYIRKSIKRKQIELKKFKIIA